MPVSTLPDTMMNHLILQLQAVYEANVPIGYNRPHEHSSVREMEKWIRDKYERKRFMAKPHHKSSEKPQKKDTNMIQSSSAHRGSSKQNRSSTHTRERARRSVSNSPSKGVTVRQHHRDEKVVEDLLSFAHDDVITVSQQISHNNGKNLQHIHNASASQPGCISLPVSPVPSLRKPPLSQQGNLSVSQGNNHVAHNVLDFGDFQSALGQQPRPRSLPAQHSDESASGVKQNDILPTDAILSMFNPPQYTANAASNMKMATPEGRQMTGCEAAIPPQYQMSPLQAPGLMVGHRLGEPVGIPGQGAPLVNMSPTGGLGMNSSMDQNRMMPDNSICNPQVLQYSQMPVYNGQKVAACGQNGSPSSSPQIHQKDHFADLF